MSLQKRARFHECCPEFCGFILRKWDSQSPLSLFEMAIFPSKYALFLRRAFEKPLPAKISGRATVAPVKNDDFGGVSHPLAGKRFCVTENISRNGKHSLLSPEHTMFRDSKNGSNITPRSRLFAGQSEEANSPFPKSISGTKQHRNGMNKS